MGKLLTLKEAADILNVRVPTLRKFIKNKKILAVKLSNIYRIDVEDLQVFIKNQKN